MSAAYLTILLVTLGCMVLCDWRWRLAFFHDARRAALLSVVVVGAFLVWDALGIVTGSFYRGASDYMTGIELAPEMPIEEPIFLFFHTYLTINFTSGARLLLDARANRSTSSSGSGLCGVKVMPVLVALRLAAVISFASGRVRARSARR